MSTLRKGDIVYYSGWNDNPHISGYPHSTAKYLGIVIGFNDHFVESLNNCLDVQPIVKVVWFLKEDVKVTKEYSHCLRKVK